MTRLWRKPALRVAIGLAGAAAGLAAVAVAGAVAVLGAGAVAAAGATASSAAAKRPPAHMLVYAQEWSLWASRTSVPAGAVKVQLWNRGQDAHDLRIRRINRHGHLVGHPQAVALTGSGAVSDATWHLRAGKYLMFCSLPQHRKRGMHTRIVVR